MAESGVINYSQAQFKELQDNLEVLGADVLKLADNMVGDLGSEARKTLGKQFESKLQMGQQQLKWKSGKHTSGYVVKTFSHMDSKHGWYKGNAQDTRLIGFKYENVAYQKSGVKTLRGKFNATSKGYVQSLIANLFARPAHYKEKNSPWFRRAGEYRSGRWTARTTRPAYVSFTASNVQSAIQPTMEKTQLRIHKLLENRELIK